MVFSSLLFLFRFLPIALLFYYAVPSCMNNMWKNLVLFFFSLIFYAWGEPVYIILMLFSTLVDYINGRLTGYFIDKNNRGMAKVFLISSIVINLTLLGTFKYAGFICDILSQISGLTIHIKELALPIGISFYTFQTMSYTIDVYRGDAKPEKNIITFGAYVSMFPQLIAGPIVRFHEIAEQLKNRKVSLEKINYGILRFVSGLGKKVLLANNAGLVWTTVIAYSEKEMTMAAAWLGLLFYMFQTYFDFSGYSDMAIGLMAMLGFEIPENFRYPYTSKSITEFWRRWHISLGTWFREYVYIPLGGNRKGKMRAFFNIFVVWFLTGLWHGASINFICWGLYFGVFLVLEKQGLLRWLEQCPSVLEHLYTLIIICFGWLLFAWEDMDKHGIFVKAMAGIGTAGIVDQKTIYLFMTNFILLIILIVGSTMIPKRIWERSFGIKETKRTEVWTENKQWKYYFHFWIREVLQVFFIASVFLLSIAYLVNASYNPFLYFRF